MVASRIAGGDTAGAADQLFRVFQVNPTDMWQAALNSLQLPLLNPPHACPQHTARFTHAE